MVACDRIFRRRSGERAFTQNQRETKSAVGRRACLGRGTSDVSLLPQNRVSSPEAPQIFELLSGNASARSSSVKCTVRRSFQPKPTGPRPPGTCPAYPPGPSEHRAMISTPSTSERLGAHQTSDVSATSQQLLAAVLQQNIRGGACCQVLPKFGKPPQAACSCAGSGPRSTYLLSRGGFASVGEGLGALTPGSRP